jgi:xylulokinase
MIVGVDIGTQSLKAVILTADLEVLGQHAVAYQPEFPQPGWAQQDPKLWENALRPAIEGALRAANCKAGQITALGIAGQLDGCVPVDGEGLPLHPCLIWMDRRAEAEISDIDARLIQERCGLVLDASHLAAKIRWLKQHVPVTREAACFHVPVSYVVSRLTGQRVIDHATASTSMVFGLATQNYDDDLLQLFGISRSELPEPVPAQRLAGRLTETGSALTGLPVGVPVAVGTGDDFASTLGAGSAGPGRLIDVLGTAEVVGALHQSPVIDKASLVETHAFPGGLYFVENPGWLSGGAVAWFRQVFGLEDFAALDAEAAATPPGAGGVTFVPALSGAMAPEWIASARGAFYGLTPSHGRGHMARAVLEGTAFAMRDVLERVRSLGVGVDAIRCVGGGAKSAFWTQLRADLTGIPVEIARHVDTSPIGAAMLAGVAAGQSSDLGQSAAKLNEGLKVVHPDPSKKPAYDAAYEKYYQLFKYLRPLF